MSPLVRRLTPPEIEAYDLIPQDIAERVLLVRVPLLPGPYSGMTLGPLVLLAKTIRPDSPHPLLAHELVHVRQFHEMGLPLFTWRYNRAFVKGLLQFRSWNKAYRAIPAEQEARSLAADWQRRRAATAAAARSALD